MWTFQPLTALSDRSELVSFNCVQRSNKISITKMMGVSFMADVHVVSSSLRKPCTGRSTQRPLLCRCRTHTRRDSTSHPGPLSGGARSQVQVRPLSLALTEHGWGVSLGGTEWGSGFAQETGVTKNGKVRKIREKSRHIFVVYLLRIDYLWGPGGHTKVREADIMVNLYVNLTGLWPRGWSNTNQSRCCCEGIRCDRHSDL